jgi:hypothetical protein
MPSRDFAGRHIPPTDDLDLADAHERAAARHTSAAATFKRLGDSERADRERTLAYEQRRKALAARQRAITRRAGEPRGGTTAV